MSELDLGPVETPDELHAGQARRVIVRRRPSPEYPGRPWRAVVVDLDGLRGDEPVGRYPSVREAVMRGITASRFIAAGLPWRAEL